MFTTTTTDGIGFTHTIALDDTSLLKFFGGILATTLVIILLHKVAK